MKSKKNPIRLRSKIYLLIYPFAIDVYNLKKFIQEAFKVKSDSEWKYVIKQEAYCFYTNETFVLLNYPLILIFIHRA
jgi:hypothetical protein